MISIPTDGLSLRCLTESQERRGSAWCWRAEAETSSAWVSGWPGRGDYPGISTTSTLSATPICHNAPYHIEAPLSGSTWALPAGRFEAPPGADHPRRARARAPLARLIWMYLAEPKSLKMKDSEAEKKIYIYQVVTNINSHFPLNERFWARWHKTAPGVLPNRAILGEGSVGPPSRLDLLAAWAAASLSGGSVGILIGTALPWEWAAIAAGFLLSMIVLILVTAIIREN